ISYTYSNGNLSVQTIDASMRQSTKTTDATGKVVSSSDNGGTLNFKYDSYGNQIEVKNGSVTVLSTTYDACNHKTSVTEPNSGFFQYSYDGYGQLLQQIQGSNTYNMQYDAAGRITQQDGPEGTSNYTYVAVGNNGVNN